MSVLDMKYLLLINWGRQVYLLFAKSGAAKLVVEVMIIMNMTLKMEIEKHFHTIVLCQM